LLLKETAKKSAGTLAFSAEDARTYQFVIVVIFRSQSITELHRV